MQEFKFRMWKVKEKEMIQSDCLSFDEFQPLEDQLNCDEEYEIIMQFTGILDSNGADIFQDDILRYSVPKYEKKASPNPKIIGSEYAYARICAVAGGFTFYRDIFWGDNRFLPESGDAIADMQTRQWIEHNTEIAGNIYQNPELVTKITTIKKR